MQVSCHHVIRFVYQNATLTKEERIYAFVKVKYESLYDIIILYCCMFLNLFSLVCMLKVSVNNFSIVSRQFPVF